MKKASEAVQSLRAISESGEQLQYDLLTMDDSREI